jgi:hypothetical protein
LLAFSVVAAPLMLRFAHHKRAETSENAANHRVKVLIFMSWLLGATGILFRAAVKDHESFLLRVDLYQAV